MQLVRLVPIAVAIAGLLIEANASARDAAWQELHQTANDVRIELGSDAVASVQHHVRYKIVAGHFKTFDVSGIDPRGELSSEAHIVSDKDGLEVPARVERLASSPGAVRIVTQDGKPLGRGSYAVDVRYRLDFVAAGLVAQEGAMWTVSWTTPPAREGQDSTRIVFSLPSARTEPRVAATMESTTTLSTLRRTDDRDELELVRVHIPSGEAATWSARIDPRALDAVTAPHLRPERLPFKPTLSERFSRPFAMLAWCSIALGAAWLLWRKRHSVAQAAALRSVEGQPLIAKAVSWQPPLYGLVLAAAFASLLGWSPWLGGTLTLVAMALASHRIARRAARPRGPGVWRRVPDVELLGAASDREPASWLDATTTPGRVTLGLLVLAVLGASVGLHGWMPSASLALPIGCASILPIFVTGTRAQMPPRPKDLALRILKPVRNALGKRGDLEHVDLGFIARELQASHDIDEVRLTCVPRDRTPGLRAIELAVVVEPVAHDLIAEVLVRVEEDSAAASRVAQLAPGKPIVIGRSLDEKVLRLRLLDARSASLASMLERLVLALEGRRASDRGERTKASASWHGIERRGAMTMSLGTALPS